MKTIRFWSRWLLITGELMSIFGIYMLIHFLKIQDPSTDVFFSKYYGGSDADEASKIVFSTIMAIMGATAASWGLFVVFLGYRLSHKPEKWIINTLLSCLFIWYIGDTGASLRYGAISNVLLNTLFFSSCLLPLIVIRYKINKVKISVFAFM